MNKNEHAALFQEDRRKDRRFCILAFLAGVGQGRANHFDLRRSLAALGHAESLDTVLTDLVWLREQGLVSLEDLPGAITVAVISPRGRDVAAGLAEAPGVAQAYGL